MSFTTRQLDIVHRCLRYTESSNMLGDIDKGELMELKNALQTMMFVAAMRPTVKQGVIFDGTEITDDDAGNK